MFVGHHKQLSVRDFKGAVTAALRSIRCAALCSIFGLLLACDGARVSEPLLSDVSQLAGLTAWSGAPEPRYPLDPAPLLTGGIALLDIDLDGDLDLFLAGAKTSPSEQVDPSGAQLVTDQLWLNESTQSGIRLTDSSSAFGLLSTPADGSTGAAVGDANRDGFPDIWVTSVRQDRLLLNIEGHSFAISEPANTSGWGASAVWFDVNQDGLDDIFITRVVDPEAGPRQCVNDKSIPDYCSLEQFDALPDQLLLNQGIADQDSVDPNAPPSEQVKFRDVSTSWGLAERAAVSLSTILLDANNDGHQDIYVATYGGVNQLWLNRSGRGLSEVATTVGAAGEWLGRYQHSVGVVSDDVNDDGYHDIWLTQHEGQQNVLLLNQPTKGFLPQFLDVSERAGIAAKSRGAGGAGAVSFDVDGDGRRDLFVANGSFSRQQQWINRDALVTTQQENSLWLNQMNNDNQSVGFINEVSDTARVSPRVFTSRGAARGDLDNDGDTDLVVSNYQGPVQIYQNNLDPERWLGVVPRLSSGALAAVGASAWLVSPAAGQRQIVQRSMGLLSSSDPRLLFYPPTVRMLFTVRVRWADAQHEDFELKGINQYHDLIRGQGSKPQEENQ